MDVNTFFDNTEVAFANKSDKELKHAYRLFSMMRHNWLIRAATVLTPLAINAGLPVRGLIRKTIFKQFVGGETLEQTIPVAKTLFQSNVQAILDYGVEGKQGEASYDDACEEFVRVIKFAATQPNIPYMSVKVTGIARFSLLEKIDSLMQQVPADSLISRYNAVLQQLPNEEQLEWQRVQNRFKKICNAANEADVGFLVDAEESWIQDPIDALTMLMMVEHNKTKLVIYNTLQMYRHDRMECLIKCFEASQEKNFLFGAKLVRGAYMEKERRRAKKKGYSSPIQPDKASTDTDFNNAVKFCVQNLQRIGLMVASHNEYSNMLAVELLQQNGVPLNHPHVHFSQLYGMSDNITFNLAKAGCSVSKYLPFGPIKDVIPY
ncbi:MAG: proline dehydrogenase family protein, partial [Chitinophagaceae bacterium]|nr:proline dehydrogenase family protein [Chitinophagaceae bacterium]